MRRMAQAWLLVVVVGSLQPARPGPVRAIHSEVHFIFGFTALFLLLLARNGRQEMWAIAGTCLLGLALELTQHLIYHNAMEWGDVATDLLATLAVSALFRFVLGMRLISCGIRRERGPERQ